MQKIVDVFQFDQSSVIKQDGFQIYTAKHLHQKQLYTLKKLNLKGLQDQNKYNSLLNQVSLLKELEHENIIKCHRMLKTPNSIYLVYQYVPSNNLYQIIQTQIKKLAQVQSTLFNSKNYLEQAYLKQVCSALVQMRNKNIVHLNLNPKNIFITEDGIVKIGGFIYGQMLGNQKEVQLHMIPPQSQYVAPQVLTKKIGALSSDIFSLARIFYSMQMCNEQKGLLSVGNMSNSIQSQVSTLVKRMGSKNPSIRATIQQVQTYLFRRSTKLRRSNSKSSNSNMVSTVPSKGGSSINTNTGIGSQRNMLKSQKSQRGSSRLIETSNRSKSKSRSKSIRRSNSNAGDEFQESQSSPTMKGNSKIPASQQQAKQAKQVKAFRKFVLQILRIRNFAIFLLKLSLTTANITLNSQKSTILSYLLMKKSSIVIFNLAQYVSNNEDTDIDIKATQIQKIKFSSKPDFFKVSTFINKQMIVQKKMLQRTRKDIQEEYPQLTKNQKFSLQLKKDSLDQKYLKQTVMDYMKLLIEDEGILQTISKVHLQGIFMLGQVLSFQSYEKMFQNLIKDQEIDLQSQPLFLHVKAMDLGSLISGILKKIRKYT